MSIIVWLIAYFAMIYWVMIPAFGEPTTFLGWMGLVVGSWVAAEIVQGTFEGGTKAGNKGQMVYVAKARREFGAVLEKRTIIVSAWEAVDPDNPDPVTEEDHEADG